MWKCPVCNRHLVKEGSNHTCKIYTEEALTSRKPQTILDAYYHLKSLMLEWEGVIAEPNAYGLELMVNRRFASLHPHVGFLHIGFMLTHPVDEFPVESNYKFSKLRYSHLMRIESISDIDKQLISWLREAYFTVGLI